jgi:glutathione synthase/RimK-type ligase-like ATP-grasp enzyme
MTSVIITRAEWEKDSTAGVARQMRNPTVAVENRKDGFPDATDCVFRWGCTANVPTRNVVNRAASIHLVADKPEFRKLLRNNAPATIPTTWFDSDGLVALRNIGREFPVVVRPKQHQRGQDFHVCNTTDEMMAAIARVGGDYYISKFYRKANEYRVFIVQGRVAFVVEKVPNNRNANAWGLARNWINVRWGDWNLEVVKKSIDAYKQSGLNFAAADVIVDVNGGVYVCELNTAAELVGEYQQLKVAMCFDHIIDSGSKDDIPVGAVRQGWKAYIHPSQTRDAA